MPIVVVAGIAEKDGRILISQRRPGGTQPLCWEFPGGKLETAETPEQALEREWTEELGVQTRTGKILHATAYTYPEKSVLLLFYRTQILAGTPRALESRQILWATREEMRALSFAPADRDVLAVLLDGEAQP